MISTEPDGGPGPDRSVSRAETPPGARDRACEHVRSDRDGGSCERAWSGTPGEAPAEVHEFTRRLADGCRRAGLDADVVAATRVHVCMPGAHARLAETIYCLPDRAERLTFFWSWGDPICLATDVADAVRLIAHVVTPPVLTARPDTGAAASAGRPSP